MSNPDPILKMSPVSLSDKRIMSYDEWIKESLDTPLEIWWIEDEPEKMLGRFETAKHFYKVEVTKENKIAWNFKFYLDQHDTKIYNTRGMKGIEADKASVLSTVVSAFKSFVEKKNPEAVQFSSTLRYRTESKESGRAKLYTALAEKACKALGFKLERTEIKDFNASPPKYEMLYTLYKPSIEGEKLKYAIDHYKNKKTRKEKLP